MGSLYIAESGGYLIRKVTGTSGLNIISTFAGTGSSGSGGDGGQATSARFNFPYQIFCSSSSQLYMGNQGTITSRVRVIGLSSGIVSTYAFTGPAVSTDAAGPATSMTIATTAGVF
eukprot:gene6125-7795_t